MSAIRTPAEAVEAACVIAGSQAALARILGVTPPTVNEWCTGKRPVPAELAPRIETFCGGNVTCAELCPGVPWHLVGAQAPNSSGAGEAMLAGMHSRADDAIGKAIALAREAADRAERELKFGRTRGENVRSVLHALTAGHLNAVMSLEAAMGAVEDAHTFDRFTKEKA